MPQRTKEIIADTRALADRCRTLLTAPRTLRERARHETSALAAEQLDEHLRTLPVGELRRAVAKGTRLKALEDAGYRTVADVRNAGTTRIAAVGGIGPQTASHVVAAAENLAAHVRADIQPRLDPTRRTPTQSRLLGTLAEIRIVDRAVATAGMPAERYSAEIEQLLPDARRAGSRWRMFFSGRDKKDAARAALARLEEIAADPAVESLRSTLGAYRTEPVPADQLWRDYERDAAAINAVLSTVGGAGDGADQEAGEGFLAPDLRREVSKSTLDTSLLVATLRGYQFFGARYALHQKRAILGDEMGLGKTVQALAVLTHLAANGQRHFLVVCPASVQVNWLNEIAKHTVLVGHSLHGPGRDTVAEKWKRDGGVAITTFGTVARLSIPAIGMLIVDEAHMIKNPGAQRSRAVAGIVRRTERALFLTGTPMENRVEEFRVLVSYLQPEVAQRIDDSDTIGGARRFRRAVAPVYLRRNQEDVLAELPDKIEVDDWVQLTFADVTAYTDAVRSRNLMRMRQAAFQSTSSAKLERLLEIVDEAREDGLKVVVFSFFLGVLDIVSRALGEPPVGPLTGSVPPRRRQELIEEFSRREGHAVLLSQIDAGGVGLNIQAASVVILTEPQWKPSTEEQAIARAHRMGQIRKVQVHRLLAKGSVDDRIREVQDGKSLLFGEFARKSDAKDANRAAVDSEPHPGEAARIVEAERRRLGIITD